MTVIDPDIWDRSPSTDRRCPQARSSAKQTTGKTGLLSRSQILAGAYRLIVELDGWIGHEADGRFRDHKRDNYSTAAESRATLRYGTLRWPRPIWRPPARSRML